MSTSLDGYIFNPADFLGDDGNRLHERFAGRRNRPAVRAG